MHKLFISKIFFLSLSVCLPFSTQANERPLFDTNLSITATLAASPVSKEQAAGIAKQHVPGRVLKVTFSNSIYRVKIVSQSGDVVSVLVDANTGERLKK